MTINGESAFEHSQSGFLCNIALSVIATSLFSLSIWRLFAYKFGRVRHPLHSPDKKHVTNSDALGELRRIRENGLRDSARVLDLWPEVSAQFHRLGIEKWAIVEQVYIASLDMADDQLACDCLSRLRAQFKKSSRVNRLFGMYLERNGRFDDARAVYTQLLNDDPTNILARKRMIAILKAQRKTVEAIEELRQYVKTFMSDVEAWNELADLYLSEGDYKHAAFCMEELLLSNPHNHLYCQRYAEIKYTEGGTENWEIARTYYAHACQLNPDSLRSLYGLLLTCSALDSQTSKSSWNSVTVLRSMGNNTTTDGAVVNAMPAFAPPNTKSEFPSSFLSVSPSGSELNGQLVRWAANRIRSIYETALTPTASRPTPFASSPTKSLKPAGGSSASKHSPRLKYTPIENLSSSASNRVTKR